MALCWKEHRNKTRVDFLLTFANGRFVQCPFYVRIICGSFSADRQILASCCCYIFGGVRNEFLNFCYWHCRTGGDFLVKRSVRWCLVHGWCHKAKKPWPGRYCLRSNMEQQFVMLDGHILIAFCVSGSLRFYRTYAIKYYGFSSACSSPLSYFRFVYSPKYVETFDSSSNAVRLQSE